MINNRYEIAYKSLYLAPASVDLDKKTRYYGTDVPILHSEVHVIIAIAEHPDTHVDGLADMPEVTKGAVSEILKKLEKKALVMKEIDDLDLSRYSLNLTGKDKKTHNNHMHYHAVLDSVIEDELKNTFEQELAFLVSFLSSLTNRVKFFNKNFDE